MSVVSTTQNDSAPSSVRSADTALASQLHALRDRGVSNPSEFSALNASTIERTVRWFDAARRTRGVGPGVLVTELRRGGRPAIAVGRLDRSRSYAAQINAWGAQNFPDLVDDRGYLHPAVFSAVMRLHARHGKGSLTVATHGHVIRQHVAAFNARYGVNGCDRNMDLSQPTTQEEAS